MRADRGRGGSPGRALLGVCLIVAWATLALGREATAEEPRRRMVPYLAIDGGVSWTADRDVRFLSLPSQLESDVGGSLGLELGTQVNDHFRFGLALLYDHVGLSARVPGRLHLAGGQSVDMLRPMWNVYLDLPLLDGLVRPYVGAGLGAAWARFDSAGLGFGRADGWGMSVAAQLGTHLRLGRGWLAKAGYRYSHTASLWNEQKLFLEGNLSSHDFLLGLRKEL